MMKLIVITILCLCISPAVFAQEADQNRTMLAPDKYDAWGDIPLADETARLDKIANQLQEWKLSVGYLVVYAGQTACRGEAAARGARAKTYLLKKGVDPWRVEWIDGGWKKQLTVEAWIWPPEFGKPKPDTKETLKLNQVKIERACKIKYRGTTQPRV